jgi:hypothetical protein
MHKEQAMKCARLALALSVLLAAAGFSAAAAVPAPRPSEKPVVQLAILLDTSGSMDGLIDQAKTQLWSIVNEFARSRINGQRPEIQVALYHYGTPSLGSQTNFIKQLDGLTTDLDKISEDLFALKTDGGDEYCGAVIEKATADLQWSTNPHAYKAIFIAGNEPFSQGPIDFRKSCKAAIAKGILVNTIFCGAEAEGVATGWKEGATLADGAFLTINQNVVTVAVATPQDKEIADLSAKLNTTYVPYGAGGGRGAQRQAAQDANASASPAGASVAAERASAKASAAYSNGSWDLVDAVKDQKVDVAAMKEAELPEDMRKLDAKGRADYVAAKTKEREALQKQVADLAAARTKYLAEHAQDKDATLGAAVISAVHQQGEKAQMVFDKK